MMAVNHGSTLSVNCPSRAASFVDSQRLNEVLLNLIDNALRHTPRRRGGGRHPLFQRNGSFVTVTDNGSGISATELPHVFGRFYRGDRSRSRETGGTGLGLAIARQLVEAHGGRIWVDSPPPGADQGAEFGLMVPRLDSLHPG